jgi:hypothetical protein
MRFLTGAPESLGNEILKRTGGQMQPKATEGVFNALSRVHPTGVLSIISLIAGQRLNLPTYFLAQALRLLKVWERETHLKLRVASNPGDTSFAEWILSARLAQDKKDSMFHRALSGERDLAVRMILENYRDDENSIKVILGQMEPMSGYNEQLFEFLVANPNLSALALKVFSGAFDTFPESALLRAIDTPGNEFGAAAESARDIKHTRAPSCPQGNPKQSARPTARSLRIPRSGEDPSRSSDGSVVGTPEKRDAGNRRE